MFEDATFHSSGVLPNQTPKWMLLALAVNLALLSTLVALPLLYPEGLPARLLQRALYAPAPPPAAHPQPRSSQPAAVQTSIFRNPFTAPPVIPTLVSTAPDNPPPSIPIGVGSLSDGVQGGSGIADSPFHTNPPQVVHPPQPQSVAVSSRVTEGLLIYKTIPVYPAIARAAGLSGTIVLAATISKNGTIEDLRVQSGPAMLRQAAIDAVKSWRYRPYLLNNQPVEVETTVNVVFSMGGR
jgi:protein TonB